MEKHQKKGKKGAAPGLDRTEAADGNEGYELRRERRRALRRQARLCLAEGMRLAAALAMW